MTGKATRATIRWAFALVALLAPAAALAQRGAGPGQTPVGRDGYLWQTDVALQQERLRELAAELDREPLERWKARAAAWIEIEVAADGSGELVRVPASHHVGDLEVDKADVAGFDLGYQPSWEIRPRKKLPGTLTLVLTDDGGTRVECPLRDAVEDRVRGYVGVFVLEESRTVHCLPRGETPSAG